MILRKFARALLTIATGSLACGVAQADSVIVAAIGETGRGFDSRLSAFDLPGNLSGGIGLGSFTLASEPLTKVLALPSNFSGAWVTSFSNLGLPAGVFSQSVSAQPTPPGSHDWVAALPPDFEVARDDWMISFSDLHSPARDYWKLLREPLASPDFRNWLTDLPSSFEMARDWKIEL